MNFLVAPLYHSNEFKIHWVAEVGLGIFAL
jgi:hypothetical protein